MIKSLMISIYDVLIAALCLGLVDYVGSEQLVSGLYYSASSSNKSFGVCAGSEISGPVALIPVGIWEHVIVLCGPGDILIGAGRYSVNIFAWGRVFKLDVRVLGVEALDQFVQGAEILPGIGETEVVTENHE